jgi:hypothetical protein
MSLHEAANLTNIKVSFSDLQTKISNHRLYR